MNRPPQLAALAPGLVTFSSLVGRKSPRLGWCPRSQASSSFEIFGVVIDGTNVARTEPNAMSGFGVPMLDIGIALGLALNGLRAGLWHARSCFLSTSSGRKRAVPRVGTGRLDDRLWPPTEPAKREAPTAVRCCDRGFPPGGLRSRFAPSPRSPEARQSHASPLVLHRQACEVERKTL